MTVGKWATLSLVIVSACADQNSVPNPPPVGSIVEGDTVRLSLSLNIAEATSVMNSDQSFVDIGFPSDVATLSTGRVAILDRMSQAVVLHDPRGGEVARFGRRGEGPGEYLEPYAIASAGEYVAVWDKNGRLTSVRSDGSIAGTTELVHGDMPSVWQRMPTTNWEEPFQLSREDVTRRISGLAPGMFGVLLQDRDERFDSMFVAGGVPERFSYYVVVVDSLATPVDTLIQLPGPELRLVRPPGQGMYAIVQERPYALRPIWGAGDGWYAWGHGSRNAVSVLFDSGDSLVIEWPRDTRPLAAPDYHHYIDWEIEGYRRTRGDRLASRASEISRKDWIEELDVSDERPQISGMLGSGRCLALAGFRPEHGPHGESEVWVVLNLDRLTEPEVVRVQAGPGFVRDFADGHFFVVAVTENGLRQVHRVPSGSGVCSPTV